jgi:hypothetical protein
MSQTSAWVKAISILLSGSRYVIDTQLSSHTTSALRTADVIKGCPAWSGVILRESIATRKLTKRDLGDYDGKALHAIEAIANSASYLGGEAYRNALILDTELRSSNVLAHFFRDGGVAELQPGFNLLRDERAWEKVSNTVFFNAIRMAGNNYSLRMTPLHAGAFDVR